MIDILHENGPCFVVNKPTGVLTQAPPNIDSIERRMKDFLRHREGKTGNVYLGVPHRLDRPVSGTLILCRHARAARRISEQFEARTIRKIYHTLVAGYVAEDSGTWTDFMRKVPGEAMSEFVPADHPEAREAVLHYCVLRRVTSATTATVAATLLEIELETGRMHQIRLQCGGRGHAIHGDAQYGSTIPFGDPCDDLRLRPIALHAHRIIFRHPSPEHTLTDITAPKPAPWNTWLPEPDILLPTRQNDHS